MSREWQRGDVAVVNGHVALRLAYSGFTCPTTHKSDGDHWHVSDGHWARDDSTGHRYARPLVVIDPEDSEQVERLCELVWAQPFNVEDADAFQAALRALANPKAECPWQIAFEVQLAAEKDAGVDPIRTAGHDDVIGVLRAAARHPYKGPNDTDASMLREAAKRAAGGFPVGGSWTQATTAKVLRLVADLIEESGGPDA